MIANNKQEDSLILDLEMSQNNDGASDDGSLVHEMVGGITKRDEKKLMTETGTILLERKAVEDQIDEIL